MASSRLDHCFGSFRREHFAGWAFHPLEQHRLFTAHTLSSLCKFQKAVVQRSTWSVGARKRRLLAAVAPMEGLGTLQRVDALRTSGSSGTSP
jgi:hypothetical protein